MGNSSLAAGATISHYRIVSKLGAGETGEAYRARDTKLNRATASTISAPTLVRVTMSI